MSGTAVDGGQRGGPPQRRASPQPASRALLCDTTGRCDERRRPSGGARGRLPGPRL